MRIVADILQGKTGNGNVEMRDIKKGKGCQ